MSLWAGLRLAPCAVWVRCWCGAGCVSGRAGWRGRGGGELAQCVGAPASAGAWREGDGGVACAHAGEFGAPGVGGAQVRGGDEEREHESGFRPAAPRSRIGATPPSARFRAQRRPKVWTPDSSRSPGPRRTSPICCPLPQARDGGPKAGGPTRSVPARASHGGNPTTAFRPPSAGNPSRHTRPAHDQITINWLRLNLILNTKNTTIAL